MKIGLKASKEVVAKDVNCSMNFGNVSMSDMILMYEAFSELAEADADLNHETSEWDLEVELEAQTKDGEDPSDSDGIDLDQITTCTSSTWSSGLTTQNVVRSSW